APWALTVTYAGCATGTPQPSNTRTCSTAVVRPSATSASGPGGISNRAGNPVTWTAMLSQRSWPQEFFTATRRRCGPRASGTAMKSNTPSIRVRTVSITVAPSYSTTGTLGSAFTPTYTRSVGSTAPSFGAKMWIPGPRTNDTSCSDAKPSGPVRTRGTSTVSSGAEGSLEAGGTGAGVATGVVTSPAAAGSATAATTGVNVLRTGARTCETERPANRRCVAFSPACGGHATIRSVAESCRSDDHAAMRISAPGCAKGMAIAPSSQLYPENSLSSTNTTAESARGLKLTTASKAMP